MVLRQGRVSRYGAKLFADTRACGRKPQVGHCYTNFSVVPAFAVAVLVKPISVGAVAWEQVAWWSQPAARYKPRVGFESSGQGGIRSALDRGVKWEQGR